MNEHHRWCERLDGGDRGCTCRPRFIWSIADSELLKKFEMLIAAVETAKDDRSGLLLRDGPAMEVLRAARELAALDQGLIDDLVATFASQAFPPDHPNTRDDVRKAVWALQGLDWRELEGIRQPAHP